MLTVQDDPVDLAATVNDQWRVTEMLSLGRIVDNSPVACPASAICKGDFVDVGVSFDVVVKRDRKGGKSVRAHLKLQHVLQLLPARQVGSRIRNHAL